MMANNNILEVSKTGERVGRLIEQLGETGIKALFILYEKENCTLLDLKKHGLSYSSIYRIVPMMKEFGLVEEHAEGIKRVLTITEKGKKLAEILFKAEELLKSP